MALLFLQLMGYTEMLVNEDQEDAAVFQVLRYVETNYVQGSFAEISQRLHYDPSWLSREIKRETGKTLSEYVRYVKIEYAKTLLAEDVYSLTELSMRLGYYDYSHFYKAFLLETGARPTEYLPPKG